MTRPQSPPDEAKLFTEGCSFCGAKKYLPDGVSGVNQRSMGRLAWRYCYCGTCLRRFDEDFSKLDAEYDRRKQASHPPAASWTPHEGEDVEAEDSYGKTVRGKFMRHGDHTLPNESLLDGADTLLWVTRPRCSCRRGSRPSLTRSAPAATPRSLPVRP